MERMRDKKEVQETKKELNKVVKVNADTSNYFKCK